MYLFLSRVVEVQATDAPEIVTLRRVEAGVELEVALAATPQAPYFHRTFDPRETRELRIYLHGGDDRVVNEAGARADPPAHRVGSRPRPRERLERWRRRGLDGRRHDAGRARPGHEREAPAVGESLPCRGGALEGAPQHRQLETVRAQGVLGSRSRSGRGPGCDLQVVGLSPGAIRQRALLPGDLLLRAEERPHRLSGHVHPAGFRVLDVAARLRVGDRPDQLLRLRKRHAELGRGAAPDRAEEHRRRADALLPPEPEGDALRRCRHALLGFQGVRRAASSGRPGHTARGRSGRSGCGWGLELDSRGKPTSYNIWDVGTATSARRSRARRRAA